MIIEKPRMKADRSRSADEIQVYRRFEKFLSNNLRITLTSRNSSVIEDGWQGMLKTIKVKAVARKREKRTTSLSLAQQQK